MKDELEKILDNLKYDVDKLEPTNISPRLLKIAKRALQNYCEQKCREARIDELDWLMGWYTTKDADGNWKDYSMRTEKELDRAIIERIKFRLSDLQTTSEADNG